MSHQVLLVGNDQTLTLEGLQDAVSGEYQNLASCTARILTRSGDVVVDNIELEYVADTDGNFAGLIEDGVQLTHGKTYIIEITALGADDLVAFWRWAAKAMYRTP